MTRQLPIMPSDRAEEMAWKDSVRRHNERIRRQRKGEWYCYFAALADSLRASADHYERRALELLEDENPNKRRNA